MGFVEVVVQDDDATSSFRRLLHLDDRPFRLADPLKRAGRGYDVEIIPELVARTGNAGETACATTCAGDRRGGTIACRALEETRNSRQHPVSGLSGFHPLPDSTVEAFSVRRWDC